MLSYVLANVILLQKAPIVTYEYLGKVGTQKASITIDWPKGSKHKTVEKLQGVMFLGNNGEKVYFLYGKNKSFGRIEFTVTQDKKKVGALRLMRDPKKSGSWTGDYYLPKQKPIPVSVKSIGPVEVGC